MRPCIRSIRSVVVSTVMVGVVGLISLPSESAFAQQPVAAAPAAAAQPLPAAEAQKVLDKVQAFYDKTTSFKADFTQEFTAKFYNKKSSSKGRVTFAKPGKMDWVYDEPKDNRVVSDGTEIRVYEAANKQMYQQQMSQSQYPAALSFLTGQGKLADHFTFQLFTGESMGFPGGQVLVGLPKVANPAASKVLFYIDVASSQVRRVMVIDGQGNRNRFDFVNPRVNEPVTDQQFKFNPPQGTTVVRP
jgi:outer membrane lipoprotein carrier protein